MEILLSLFTTIVALWLFPWMYSLLQDSPEKNAAKPMWLFGMIGFVISGVLNCIVMRNFELFPVFISGLYGALCGELLVLFFEVIKKTQQAEVSPFYDDGTPPRFYITGDKHRNFNSVEQFCREMNTRKKDVLIVLGDAGFNYFEDKRDQKLKERASNMNITLFCIHGNKEKRPANMETYGKRSFCGGKVYYEPKYPNILFAIDGEIYNFEGKKYFVMGGAHSVDKNLCLEKGLPYWGDEMPTPALMHYAEEKLAEHKNNVYGVLSHTCPFQYLPVEMFVTTRRNEKRKQNKRSPKIFRSFKRKIFEPDIDRTTEYWLGELEQKIRYKQWFCGHYHIDKQIDKVTMMFKEIRPLHQRKES